MLPIYKRQYNNSFMSTMLTTRFNKLTGTQKLWLAVCILASLCTLIYCANIRQAIAGSGSVSISISSHSDRSLVYDNTNHHGNVRNHGSNSNSRAVKTINANEAVLTSKQRHADDVNAAIAAAAGGVVAIENSDVGSKDVLSPGMWVDLQQPLSRITLGRAVWSFLHQTAAMYPQSATIEQQEAAKHLMMSITHLYPCKMCRDNFKEYVAAHPIPALTSRYVWQEWLCHAHNDVNQRTDKSIVDCSQANLQALWPSELKASCDCQVLDSTANPRTGIINPD